MNFKKISDLIGKWMAVIIVIVAVLSLFIPSLFSWIKTGWVNYLLGIAMFGMGLTLTVDDFKGIISHPFDVAIGTVAQFTVMPLLAFLLTKIFGLPVELAIGVILVGTCPGGTASNVMTYLSEGNVALSVSMTICSTLLAPVLTPLLTLLYAGQRVDVNAFGMLISVVKVVLLPVVVGFIINLFFHKQVEKCKDILPLVSTMAVVMIVASVVSANAEKIIASIGVIFIVVILHNVLGYIIGYAIGAAFRMDYAKKKALSIEVGMQNSGLATSLATTHFASYPMAAIPGAVFSVWHNISGAILANIYRLKFDKGDIYA